jgi:hypothetical protein
MKLLTQIIFAPKVCDIKTKTNAIATSTFQPINMDFKYLSATFEILILRRSIKVFNLSIWQNENGYEQTHE